MVFTLKSGKEVELKHIGLSKRYELYDVFYEKNLKGLPLSWELCLKCVRYATGLTDDELEKNWTDEDIVKAGTDIFMSLEKSELEKKS